MVAGVKSVSLELLSLDLIRKYAVLPSLVCCNIDNAECLSLSSQLLTDLMHLYPISTAHSEPLHCLDIVNKFLETSFQLPILTKFYNVMTKKKISNNNICCTVFQVIGQI